jgi:CRP-like cAMP-binding protein
VTAQGLRQMQTLRHAYLETLRFHPVALGLPFLVEEGFEFGGTRICKGDRVVVTPLPAHFSPEHYTDPHTFDCGRCADPRGEIHAPGAFAPFGFGGRVCAAAGLVEVISLATMATLLHVADLRLAPSDYIVRSTLDPLPGPEPRFAIEMGGLRSPRTVTPASRQFEELLAVPATEGTSPAWRALLKRVERARYAAGMLIIREGDVAEHFFIVTEGEAEVFRTQGADDTRLALLKPGDHFGEIGLLRRIARTASVRAASALDVLVVDRETFLAMIAESDFVSEQIAENVRRRITANRLADALPHLEQDQTGRLLPNVHLTRFSAGAVIIRQGDPAESFFVVASGRVDVVRRTPNGRDRVVNQLEAGEWFGEMGILNGAPRNATVRVVSDADAEVLVVDKEDFIALVRGSDATRTDVWAMMARRLADLESLGN